MEPSPRCPVCSTPVAEDRITAIQANLASFVDAQIVSVRKKLETESRQKLDIATLEAQEAARKEAAELADQNSKLRREIADGQVREREARANWEQKEQLLNSEFETRLELAKELAAKAARQQAELKASTLQEQLTTTTDRLTRAEAQVSTLRAEHSHSLERLSEEFVARLETEKAAAVASATIQLSSDLRGARAQTATLEAKIEELAQAAKTEVERLNEEFANRLQKETTSAVAAATAQLSTELNDARVRAAALEAKVSEIAATAKAEAVLVIANIEREHTQEILEVRQAYETSNQQELGKQEFRHRTELERLKTQMSDMQRQIDKQTADELGRWPELDLCQALREEFPDDQIRPVGRGQQGADIVQEVFYKGEICGKIVYDSKNQKKWLTDYVDKLRKDRDVEDADYAVLSTNAFPASERQRDLCLRNEVLVARPHTVVPLAAVIREAIVKIHRLGLTANERANKMAELYTLITSEPFRNRMLTARKLSEQLDGIDVDEKKQHDNVWKKRGIVVADLRRTLREIDEDVASVVEHVNHETQIA